MSFVSDGRTGAYRLVRGPARRRGVVDMAVDAFSFTSMRLVLGVALLVALTVWAMTAQPTDAAHHADLAMTHARNGDWAGGLRSLFMVKMLADPRPLEVLLMAALAPIAWKSLPQGLRLILFPVIAQCMFIAISNMALIPTEFALMTIFAGMMDQLSALI